MSHSQPEPNLDFDVETVILSITDNASAKKTNRLETAVDVIRSCMEAVEKLPGGLHGSDKLAIVQTILGSREQLARLNIPQPLMDAIEVMVRNNLVKPTVDVICQATQGKLDINKSVACCTAFISAWFSARGSANKAAKGSAKVHV